MTSNSKAVCTVGSDGLTVTLVAPGTCSLTPKVAASANYLAATGTAQTFQVNPVTSSGGSVTQGYWMAATDGGIFNYGDAGFYGSAGGSTSTSPSWAWPPRPTARATGWWPPTAASSPTGTPASTARRGLHLNKPIVGMAATPDGKGYWLVASDGGIFTYGDAGFYGSTGGHPPEQAHRGHGRHPRRQGLLAGGLRRWHLQPTATPASTARPGSIHLNQPIVGMAATPDGKGYWLVASDGGIFTYGDAGFYGSTGAIHLNSPIVGMAATPDGKGYWLVAADGGVFTYGDAGFYGSAGGVHLNQPVIGIAPGP